MLVVPGWLECDCEPGSVDGDDGVAGLDGGGSRPGGEPEFPELCPPGNPGSDRVSVTDGMTVTVIVSVGLGSALVLPEGEGVAVDGSRPGGEPEGCPELWPCDFPGEVCDWVGDGVIVTVSDGVGVGVLLWLGRGLGVRAWVCGRGWARGGRLCVCSVIRVWCATGCADSPPGGSGAMITPGRQREIMRCQSAWSAA